MKRLTSLACRAILLGSVLILPLLVLAQEESIGSADESLDFAVTETAESVAPTDPQRERRPLGYSHTSDDSRQSVHVWLRAQVRLSRPFDTDPLTRERLDDAPGSNLDIRRARVNASGQLFGPAVNFFYIQELADGAPLLGLGLDLVRDPSLSMRIGQYKVLYNRERVDASGTLQFVERSIATYAFTLDRQRGVTVAKRWAAGTPAQNRLLAGVFEGTGRAAEQHADEPLVVLRWEWDFLGEALPFSQSDLSLRATPAASLAFGMARVEGPYTRFSTAGGGQLIGFEPGDSSRYAIDQWLQEFTWHYRGFSLQQEYHVKKISDRETARDSELTGGYLQLGKVWPVTGARRELPVELAFRYARVSWHDTPLAREQREVTAVVNLFLEGHRNKLSLDLSRITLGEGPNPTAAGTRLRAQWEVSF